MKDSRSTYRAWAPDDALWTQWAKPVLFARPPAPNNKLPGIPAAKWAPFMDGKTALIVDLPGNKGVLQGLALAQAGYRPVPLYNGVHAPNQQSMAVDVSGIVDALFQGSYTLEQLSIRPDAAPVFLLDADRMNVSVRPAGKYDNRWCIFPQDMPSASFLIAQGIRQVQVRAAYIQNDLSHILRRYQEKGIPVFLTNDSGIAEEVTVVRPSRFRSLLYRVRTMTGLSRNAAGGFGGSIPEPTQSSGVRYYGIG